MKQICSECPICKSERFKYISPLLIFCVNCRIVINEGHEEFSYAKEYFCSEYEEQYGRTYAEDYDSIYSVSRKRIHTITSLLSSSKPISVLSLLDIGSALGFFLKCAKDHGFEEVSGIEISEYGCSYSKEELQINTLQMSFDDYKPSETFDVITAWYFLEHCKSQSEVIEKIYSMLNRGGIFAAAMPSLRGPAFMLNRQQWIETHPKDHRIDFSPKSISKLLKSKGFTRVIVKPAGFHPERILSEKSMLYRPFSFFYKWFSNVFRYSDTMEIYAMK